MIRFDLNVENFCCLGKLSVTRKQYLQLAMLTVFKMHCHDVSHFLLFCSLKYSAPVALLYYEKGYFIFYSVFLFWISFWISRSNLSLATSTRAKNKTDEKLANTVNSPVIAPMLNRVSRGRTILIFLTVFYSVLSTTLLLKRVKQPDMSETDDVTLNSDVDNSNSLAAPYQLHKTDKSRGEVTNSDSNGPKEDVDQPVMTSTSPTTDAAPISTNCEYVISESVGSKTCYSYFQDHNMSSASLSDYPTDEQTLNTFKSLNSQRRNMLRIGDAPTDACALSISATSFYQKEGSIDVDAATMEEDIPSFNHSNSSVQNDAKPIKDRLNRFKVLEMAKRRMAQTTSKSLNRSAMVDIENLKNDNLEDTVAPSTDTWKNLATNKAVPLHVSPSVYVMPSQEVTSNGQSESDSFLGDAIIEISTLPNAIVPSQPTDDNLDESLSNYNIHASTLSQSTMTALTNCQLPKSFVNVGGDAVVYLSRTLNPPNVSFDTTASPSTVLASGSRPVVVDLKGISSSGTVLPSEVSSDGTNSSRSNASNLNQSEQELNDSTMMLAGRRMVLRSRDPNVTSSLDNMILQESHLAVNSLGNAPVTKRSVIQAAASTPVRRNTTNSNKSNDSYLHNKAFRNSDKITTNPKIHSLSTADNSFESNLPDNYSFCPSSKHSTYSTLTDEFDHYYDISRRTGITAVADNRKTPSGPVDVDTNAIVDDQEHFQYDFSSFLPPAPPYRNSERLSTIILRGDGEGYVDVDSENRYASLHRSRRGHFSMVLISTAVALLAISLASVMFGIILQNNRNSNTESLTERPISMDEGPNEFVFPVSTSPLSNTFNVSNVPTAPMTSMPIASTASELSTDQLSLGNIQSASLNPIETTLVSAIPESSSSSLIWSSPNPTQSPSSSPVKRTVSPTMPSKIGLETETTFTMTIKVTRDTYVTSSKSNFNYGDSDFLSVNKDPRSITVIAFDISLSVDLLQARRRHYDATKENQSHKMRREKQLMATVEQAKLRLYSLEKSDSGGELYALTNSKTWDESTITWGNAKQEVSASGEVFINSNDQKIDQGTWVDMDVTSAFDCCVEDTENMHLNLMIRSDSSDGITYASREYKSGIYAPELILTLSTERVSESDFKYFQLASLTSIKISKPTFLATLVISSACARPSSRHHFL